MRKELPQQLLGELLKNSKRSDRDLAKILKVSQPTITRTRHKLEKDIIQGYTVIPEWHKIGFQLVAFTFVKTKIRFTKPEEREVAIQKAREWFIKQPNVIFCAEGQGMGWTGMCISFHKTYSDFAEFMRTHDSELSDFLIESQSFIVDINPGVIAKPFHFKYLAKVK